MDLENVIRKLAADRQLPTHAILQVSSTCHYLRGIIDWEDLLKYHFPSHYLMHESTYTKNTEWKSEYIKAYRALTLRYMSGGTLQNSKVVHFGPYLEKEDINEILNFRGSFLTPKVSRDYTAEMPYTRFYIEGYFDEKTYFVDDKDALHVFDENNLLTLPHVPHGTTDKLQSGVNTLCGSLLFIGAKKLNCYDLKTKQRLWYTELGGPSHISATLVAFDQMLFYFKASSFFCSKARTGEVIFQLDHPKHDAENKYEYEHADQLVFDGDFAIYMAHFKAGRYLTVVNWREKKLLHCTNIQEITDAVSPTDWGRVTDFSVSNGILFTNIPRFSGDNSVFSSCAGIDLGYTKSKSALLWNTWQGGCSVERNCGRFTFDPCVYGNMLFTLKSHNVDHERPCIIALDTLTGNLIWARDLYNDKTNADWWDTTQIYLIEGTATIEERKKAKARVPRKSGEDCFEQILKEAESNTPTNNKTQLPVLRVCYLDEGISNIYVEAGLDAETGEILFVNKSHSGGKDSILRTAISKHKLPFLLVL